MSEIDADGRIAPSQNKRKVEMPPELTAEINRMRRDPSAYSVVKLSKCRFCTAKETQYDLEPTGAWCKTHGWISFDSSGYPPTERLKPHEIAERAEATKRKRGPRK